MGQEQPDLLLATEVAALFNVTTTTVRRWARVGSIEYIRPFAKYLFPRDQPLIVARIEVINGKETAPSEKVDASDQLDSNRPED